MVRGLKIFFGVVLGLVVALAISLGVILWSIFHDLAPMPELATLPSGALVVKDGYVGIGVVPVGEGNAVLIDCGNDRDAVALKAALAKAQLTPVAALITHGHPDHVGGCGAFPGLEIVAMPDDVALAAGTAAAVSPIGRLMGANPFSVTVTREVLDGETLTYGNKQFRVFSVPGHTPGSAAYLVDANLFLGDSATQLTGGKLIHAPCFFSDDIDRNVYSLHELATRLGADEVSTIICSHSATLQAGPSALAAISR